MSPLWTPVFLVIANITRFQHFSGEDLGKLGGDLGNMRT